MANPFENQAPIPGVKHVLLVGSGKGGVGKSTVSANLALGLKLKGLNVGLLDADLYGPSLPRLFGLMGQAPEVNEDQKILPLVRYGVQLMSIGLLVEDDQALIWRGPMLFKAIDQFFSDVLWQDLDVLVVDLPPGTGDIALTIAQRVPVTGGIIVSTPQNMSLVDAKKAIDMFEKVNIPCLGLIENMSYFKASPDSEPVDLFPRGQMDTYLKEHNIPKLGALPFDPKIALSCESGIPAVEAGCDEDQRFEKLSEAILPKFL